MAKRAPARSRRSKGKADPLSILMIASEAVPFAKTGGLADVAGSLPRALARLGHRVTLVVPRYRGVQAGVLLDRWTITMGSVRLEAALFEEPLVDGARALLVDCPALYDRDAIYGEYDDNPRRFAFLVRAALEATVRAAVRPSLVHAHDWQAGLAPVYLKARFAGDSILGGVPSVFTIHNVAYQGMCDRAWLPELDLGWDLFSPQGLEFWGRASFLKAGITSSGLITSVSRKYAQEIQTREYGYGFEGILSSRAADLVGITNGIDTEVWDPSRDPLLPQPYDASDLSGKAVAKREVLRTLGLPHDPASLERPLVVIVSRLAYQKGFDLLEALAEELPRLPATFAVLGTGERRYEAFWRMMAARFPDRIGARIGFDDRLAHLMEGGGDMLLMPSRYEPCGLNQMYSLRYGTIPVVRATGGLDDTVVDFTGEPGRGGNGFKFVEYTPQALLAALRRAFDAFGRPAVWGELQREAMRQDHSWDASAAEYVKVYERAIGESPRAVHAPGPQ